MNAPVTSPTVPPYHHATAVSARPRQDALSQAGDRRRQGRKVMGKDMLVIEREALRALSRPRSPTSIICCARRISSSCATILDDPEASDNDKFVAYDFLKNANIAAGGVLPMCQDTGTAIIMGKKGRMVFTVGDDEAALAEGARDAYLQAQSALFAARADFHVRGEEHQVEHAGAGRDLRRRARDAYKLLFIAKGGGSANKAFLFQATPSILTHDRMLAFLKEKVLTLGTAACPPYHLAIVIGGTSAELTMKTVKLASTKYLDELPTQGQRGRPRLPRSRDGAGSADD